jgi:hypothetical protein
MNIKSTLIHTLLNLPGWHTRRKIVVIESDDWGSERTPNKEIFNYLFRQGLRVDLCPYSKFDTIASEFDITLLSEVLLKYKDKNDRHPIITANFNVANPDFTKIKENNFEHYFYKTLTQTLNEYPNNSKIINLWQEGIKSKIFNAQYHHREHLCPHLWLELLRNGHKALNIGFDAGVYGLGRLTSPTIKQFHLASLFYRNEIEKSLVIDSFIDGLDLFKQIFNYLPDSFIAPVYIWNSDLEKSFFENGIKVLQGARFQSELNQDGMSFSNRKIHFTGNRNKYRQINTVRNCTFEPSLMSGIDVVNKCLADINISFKWGKPAIISSHRVNFIGSLDEKNRDKNLLLFDELLSKIIKKFPDVQFMSSSELGKLIDNKS